MLRYFLENDLLNITDKAPKDWEEAMRISGEVMKKKGLVTDQYIDQVIADVKEYGPYIVIVPGVAMPHSSAKNEGVREPGLVARSSRTPSPLKKKIQKKTLSCSSCWRPRILTNTWKTLLTFPTC